MRLTTQCDECPERRNTALVVSNFHLKWGGRLKMELKEQWKAAGEWGLGTFGVVLKSR